MQFLYIPASANEFLQSIHITGIQMFCLPGNTVLLDSPDRLLQRFFFRFSSRKIRDRVITHGGNFLLLFLFRIKLEQRRRI